ncbi:hypothetical protein V6N13_040266 [Hibiscus sabdariffa]|uniref:Uncharacterized protein n=1 Tax=Hibiscus sabdariffa TaxID=183260 RepID=A0ABR2C7M4_9ROSI
MQRTEREAGPRSQRCTRGHRAATKRDTGKGNLSKQGQASAAQGAIDQPRTEAQARGIRHEQGPGVTAHGSSQRGLGWQHKPSSGNGTEQSQRRPQAAGQGPGAPGMTAHGSSLGRLLKVNVGNGSKPLTTRQPL